MNSNCQIMNQTPDILKKNTLYIQCRTSTNAASALPRFTREDLPNVDGAKLLFISGVPEGGVWRATAVRFVVMPRRKSICIQIGLPTFQREQIQT